MSEKTGSPVVPIEFLEQWEGPALLAPGVLFDEPRGAALSGFDMTRPDFISWVAIIAVANPDGHLATAGPAARVQGVLKELARHNGPHCLNEIKERVRQDVRKHAPNGTLSEKVLEQRLDAFFDAIPKDEP